MAFSATGMSLLLPKMMETLDIDGTRVHSLKKDIEKVCEGVGVWKGFFPCRSALENDDEEDAHGDKSTDQDSDQADDGDVDCVPCVDVTEGRDVAESDEICPDDSHDKTDDGHRAAGGFALSRAEVRREDARHEHDEGKREHHEGQKGHDCNIHF